MKLSEAILLGSTMSPQAVRALEYKGGRCALGSALAAVGEKMDISEEQAAYDVLHRLWPHLLYSVFSHSPEPALLCPAGCSGTPLDLESAIVHLNDTHFWSRQQIAEYIKQFEPQDEQADGGPGPGVAALEVTTV